MLDVELVVVYHLVPTSNHNYAAFLRILCAVVYHLVPTSNHNIWSRLISVYLLFIILFLHQTTTGMNLLALRFSCLSSCSYIKPQLENSVAAMAMGCLSSCSYIKPQRGIVKWLIILRCLSSCSYIKPQQAKQKKASASVVYHLVPTSNHNERCWYNKRTSLFIILFLHQTTTLQWANS